MSKCHVCKEQEAEWGWQPLGPENGIGNFVQIGEKIWKGFPIIKICSSCKLAAQSGEFSVPFIYKGHTYLAKNHNIQETNISLWNGGTCSTDSLHPSDATAIMLDTPESHELVALVLKDVPPTTPNLVKAFLIAPNLIEACEELDLLAEKVDYYLDFSYVERADRHAILMALAKIRIELKRARGEE